MFQGLRGETKLPRYGTETERHRGFREEEKEDQRRVCAVLRVPCSSLIGLRFGRCAVVDSDI